MPSPLVDTLFRPFRVKSLELKNRIVMAPMTRSRSPEGVPGEDVAAYYRRRAEAEVGLILSEGTVVDRPASRNDPRIPFFHLIDQFFWAGTNDRTNRFGGPTIKERSRFAVEVVKSVRAAVGPDFPVILRLSQWKQQDYAARLADSPDTMADWLIPLVEAGADVLHCSQRRFWEPEFPEVDGDDGLNFAGWAKKLTGAATISVGSVGLSGDMLTTFSGETSRPTPLDNLIHRMERDEFDLIAVGRAILSDPRWVVKVRAGDFEGLKDFTAAALGELV